MPPTEQPDFETVNLASMTKAQLQTYAEEHGIEVSGGLKKAEMIETIQNAL